MEINTQVWLLFFLTANATENDWVSKSLERRSPLKIAFPEHLFKCRYFFPSPGNVPHYTSQRPWISVGATAIYKGDQTFMSWSISSVATGGARVLGEGHSRKRRTRRDQFRSSCELDNILVSLEAIIVEDIEKGWGLYQFVGSSHIWMTFRWP